MAGTTSGSVTSAVTVVLRTSGSVRASVPTTLITGQAAGSTGRTTRVCGPVRAFSSSGVPCGDHLPVVDDRDLGGQLVGFLQVLGGEQHGRRRRRRGPGPRPRSRCGCAGRGRWSARPGTAPPAGDQAGGQVQPAAHPAGVRLGRRGRPRRRARTRSSSSSARCLASRLDRPVSRPIRSGSPGRSGSRRPRRTGRPVRSSCAYLVRLRSDVVPGDLARPASGLSRVARMRTAVVLPAPFGPSRPNTVPMRTWRSTPASAVVSPKRLTRPSAAME